MDDIIKFEIELAWAYFENQITQQEYDSAKKHIESLKSINKSMQYNNGEK